MNTVCFFISFRGFRTCDGVGPSLVPGLPSFVLLAFSVVRLFRPSLPACLGAGLEGIDEPVVVLVLGTPRPGRQVGDRRGHGFDGAHSGKGERCSHFLISWTVVSAIWWLWDGYASWVVKISIGGPRGEEPFMGVSVPSLQAEPPCVAVRLRDARPGRTKNHRDDAMSWHAR